MLFATALLHPSLGLTCARHVASCHICESELAAVGADRHDACELEQLYIEPIPSATKICDCRDKTANLLFLGAEQAYLQRIPNAQNYQLPAIGPVVHDSQGQVECGITRIPIEPNGRSEQ